MSMILPVAVIFTFLFVIEELSVKLEELLSIFPMLGFCNKIYNNYHKIIVWNSKKGKKNVESVMMVTVDASDFVNVGVSMSEGGGKMVQGAYSPIPRRLCGEVTKHTKTYNTKDTVTCTWKGNNDTHRGDVE